MRGEDIQSTYHREKRHRTLTLSKNWMFGEQEGCSQLRGASHEPRGEQNKQLMQF